MSIKELTKRRNEYCKYTHPANWQAGIHNFMTEVINTFKEMEDKYGEEQKKRIYDKEKKKKKIKTDQRKQP